MFKLFLKPVFNYDLGWNAICLNMRTFALLGAELFYDLFFLSTVHPSVHRGMEKYMRGENGRELELEREGDRAREKENHNDS